VVKTDIGNKTRLKGEKIKGTRRKKGADNATGIAEKCRRKKKRRKTWYHVDVWQRSKNKKGGWEGFHKYPTIRKKKKSAGARKRSVGHSLD